MVMSARSHIDKQKEVFHETCDGSVSLRKAAAEVTVVRFWCNPTPLGV